MLRELGEGRLTARPQRVISRADPCRTFWGDPMGWYAVALIVAFIVATGVLNRIEFGRFD
jgi:hypothetical protein